MDPIILESLKEQIRQELIKEEEFLKEEAQHLLMLEEFEYEKRKEEAYEYHQQLLKKMERFFGAGALSHEEYEYLKDLFK